MTGRYEDHSLEIARPPRVAPCVQQYAPMPRTCMLFQGFLVIYSSICSPRQAFTQQQRQSRCKGISWTTSHKRPGTPRRDPPDSDPQSDDVSAGMLKPETIETNFSFL